MARVPAAEIERLKREVSLERLVAAKGLKLEPRGKELAGACPFCGSEGRTLVIAREMNTWRCEGACKMGGDVIDWVRKAEGVSLRLAVEMLRSDAGALEVFTAQKRGRQQALVAVKSTTAKLPGLEHAGDDQVLLRAVFDYYHETLKQSPEALGYLEKRGLKSAEMVERFRLGFANRTLAYRLSQKNRQAGAEVRGRLQKVGVLRESGHEHLNGSLVIPVLDAEGRIVQAYGRKITPGLRAGRPLHLWLPGALRGVWNAEAFEASRQVILCDSLLNALSFWCAGFRNVTAIAGLDGPIDEHLATFAKDGIEQGMVAFRRIPEGDRAAEKVSARLVEQEGAERASYALKLLQSEEGALTIASTGKDAATGRLITQAYRVEGPVALMLTTTAIEVDEELLSRCVVLSVDEGREQTRAIHERQRAAQTLEGMLARHERQHILKLYRDAQRLLRPVFVVNPFAKELSFLDHATRTRRDYLKYLTLIRTIALLHQHQRSVKTVEHRGQKVEYVEVTREDIAVAHRLCHEVLGRGLDELPPQTRRLLGLLDEMVRAACARLAIERADYRFSRREVREHIGWGNTQLKVHLARLVELEYVLVHRGRQGQGYVYELAYDGQGKDGAPFLAGLAAIDAGTPTDSATTATSRHRRGSTRPQRASRRALAEARRSPTAPRAGRGPAARRATRRGQDHDRSGWPRVSR